MNDQTPERATTQPARYDFAAAEPRWQAEWDRRACFTVPDVPPPGSRKYYVLEMFPYPSGKIHMGHVRNYTLGDVVARYKRARGHLVMHPMGWDAFGLPAENAARERGIHPGAWTYQNIANMRAELQRMGLSLEWKREFATCDAAYYGQQQKLFLDFWKAGLVERKESWVNWDPVDGTVLANEQVIDGRGWRSGALVEKKKLSQWFLSITKYAPDLLEALGGLDRWPERVKLMQSNWIGRSEGARVRFRLTEAVADTAEVEVFTTRPDTLFGMSFLAVAAEHPLAAAAAARDPKAAEFVAECRRMGTSEAAIEQAEKRGHDTGFRVAHPFLPGVTFPVWIANFVLMEYGTGAIFGCPGHDERDFEFARKYALPILPVVLPPGANAADFALGDEAFTGDGTIFNSGFLDGLAVPAAKRRAIEALEKAGQGTGVVNWRLRDWGVSRQRYWGCPIPVIHCDDCGAVPVPEAQLPVVLPEDVDFSRPGNPLDHHPSWKHVTCPSCGKPARRETDTCDTFVDSSWYFARFCSPGAAAPVDRAAVDAWLPVDQYIGGIEHAILHLLYARFWTKVMRDLGLVGLDEPFANLFTQGMVLNHIYSHQPAEGRRSYFNPADVDVVDEGDQKRYVATRPDGSTLDVRYDGLGTMSKSKNNGVDPQSLVEKYGADTARLFMMFASPPEQTLEWSDEGVQGSFRFLRRLWKAVHEHVSAAGPAPVIGRETASGSLDAPQKALRRVAHQTLVKVTDDIGRRRTFNTAVAAVMELLNAISRFEDRSATGRAVVQEALEIAVIALSPMVPHITHALWKELGHDAALVDLRWPSADAQALVQEEITLVVQVNGKLRSQISVAVDADEAAVRAMALADETVRRFIGEATPKKVIVVPRKLVNVVV